MSEQSLRRRAGDTGPERQQSILIVDDSRTIRIILSKTLRDAGLTVMEAANGREGLDLMGVHRPDMVLLDIDMPVMNGLETMTAMQGDLDLAEIPVLFLTARTGGEDVARGLDLGAQDYLRKPCESAELLARVSTTLRLRAREQKLQDRAKALDDLSARDPLTELRNRRGLSNWLADFEVRYSSDTNIGVAMLDLDRFKAVNDTYGHGVGDAVLQVVAARLKVASGGKGVVARWGGEEFLVVVPGAPDSVLFQRAEALRLSVGENPLAVGLDEPLAVTVSIGCAAGRLGTFDDIVRRADSALYIAKGLGRNCVQAS